MSDSGGAKSFGQSSRILTPGGISPLFPLVGVVGPVDIDSPSDIHQLNIINTAFGSAPEFIYGLAAHAALFASNAADASQSPRALAVGEFADLPTVPQGTLLTNSAIGISHGGTILNARGMGNFQSGEPPVNDGAIISVACGYGWNGASWDQLISGGDNTDADPAATAGIQKTSNRNMLWTGDAWRRQQNGSNAAMFANETNAGAVVVSPAEAQFFHTPAAGVLATVDVPAEVRIPICKSIVAALIIPPAANQPIIQLNLLSDNGVDPPVIIWSRSFGMGAALASGGLQEIALTGLNISGQSNETMRLEFSAAGVAGVVQSVLLSVLWSAGN